MTAQRSPPVFFHSFPRAPCVTEEDEARINIWRHVEHEECRHLGIGRSHKNDANDRKHMRGLIAAESPLLHWGLGRRWGSAGVVVTVVFWRQECFDHMVLQGPVTGYTRWHGTPSYSLFMLPMFPIPWLDMSQYLPPRPLCTPPTACDVYLFNLQGANWHHLRTFHLCALVAGPNPPYISSMMHNKGFTRFCKNFWENLEFQFFFHK